jgi:hypothetical protein
MSIETSIVKRNFICPPVLLNFELAFILLVLSIYKKYRLITKAERILGDNHAMLQYLGTTRRNPEPVKIRWFYG